MSPAMKTTADDLVRAIGDAVGRTAVDRTVREAAERIADEQSGTAHVIRRGAGRYEVVAVRDGSDR